MSIIVRFFVARDDASAALALRTGPGQAFDSLPFGNFDPEEAAIEWECLLAGATFDELADAGEPRTVAVQDDGERVVFSLSPRLSAALADAERSGVRDAAAAWVALRAADGEVIGAEVADAILGELAVLARSARRQRHGVYCWLA